VDNQNLRVILEEFPRYELRRILQEKEISFKSNKTSELVDRLMEYDWSQQEVSDIVSRLQSVKKEQDPLGFYMCTLMSVPDLDTVVEDLVEANPAQFDEDGNPVESGYELSERSDNRLEITKWKLTEEREFQRATGSVREYSSVSSLNFIISLADDRLYIQTRNYQKAKSIRKLLQSHGFEFGEIGHQRVTSERARGLTQNFVTELEDQLAAVAEELEE